MSLRMRRTAMLTAMAALLPPGLIAAFVTSDTWWEGLLLVIGLLLSLPVLRQWNIAGYTRGGLYAAVFSVLVWLSNALTAASPLGFFSASLVTALLIQRFPRGQLLASLGLTFAIALCGAAVFVPRAPTVELAERYVLLPAAGTLLIVGVVTLCDRAWLLVHRLEQAKETEAALAVERERVRFAGDLHDIQGHALHVANLKLALAERTLRADPDRAESELVEVRRLIGETIEQTREVANARQLCEAAGITVDVRSAQPDVRSGSADGVSHPLLAQVLREATTNLLRHARPERVTITTGPGRVTVENDGVADTPSGDPHGLGRLRERLTTAGGSLSLDRPPGRFIVTARLGTNGDHHV